MEARAGRVGVQQQRLQHWGRTGRAGTGWALLVLGLPLVEEEGRTGPGPSRSLLGATLPRNLL